MENMIIKVHINMGFLNFYTYEQNSSTRNRLKHPKTHESRKPNPLFWITKTELNRDNLVLN
jgi:hypothetical protein